VHSDPTVAVPRGVRSNPMVCIYLPLKHAVRVTFGGDQDLPSAVFVWSRVIGVRVGPWFVGAIRGVQVDSPQTEAAVDPHVGASSGCPRAEPA
jgi:hypothetical protein